MRKLVAAINMTLDGFCDHTAVIADEELHENANALFRNAGAILFGRVTYQLMESSWPPIVKNPTGVGPVDEFAVLIDNIPKIVFSSTLKHVEWKNTTLVNGNIGEVVTNLKQQPGKNIFAGSPGLIVSLLQLGLVDELQLCVQPIILGKGLQLFKNINNRIDLRLLGSRPNASGAITLCYEVKS